MNRPTLTSIHNLTALIGAIAAFPLVMFVAGNVLKYEAGLLPGLEMPELHPVLLIGGIIAAIVVNAWSLCDFSVSRDERRLRIAMEITGHRCNLVVIAIAIFVFALTMIYLVVENILGAVAP